MKTLTILAALCLLAGCGPKPAAEKKFYVLTGSGISNAVITVNGEPAEAGGSVSLFVTNGSNELIIRGEVLPGYHFALGRTRDVLSGDWEQLWEVKDPALASSTNQTFQLVAPKKETEFRYPFNADVPWKWSWEAADLLPSLTVPDQEEIIRLFDGFTAALTNKSLTYESLAPPHTTVPWGDDPKRIAETKKKFGQLLVDLKAYADLTFEVAPHDDLVFDSGTRVVALHRHNRFANLYYLGHGPDHQAKNGEMVWSIESEVCYFARFRGRWKMLLQTE